MALVLPLSPVETSEKQYKMIYIASQALASKDNFPLHFYSINGAFHLSIFFSRSQFGFTH